MSLPSRSVLKRQVKRMHYTTRGGRTNFLSRLSLLGSCMIDDSGSWRASLCSLLLRLSFVSTSTKRHQRKSASRTRTYRYGHTRRTKMKIQPNSKNCHDIYPCHASSMHPPAVLLPAEADDTDELVRPRFDSVPVAGGGPPGGGGGTSVLLPTTAVVMGGGGGMLSEPFGAALATTASTGGSVNSDI